MGCRRQPRVPMTLNATVCGIDSKGRSFLDRVQVLNLSRDGALLEDVSCAINVGDQVAVRSDATTRRYRVMWVQSTADGRRVGLAGVGPAPSRVEAWLPASGIDEFIRPRSIVRREHDRSVCEIAVEMRMKDISTPLWVTASDLSEGGCRVQVPHAIKSGTEASIALWLDGERVWLTGEVTHCVYGCGTGIRFTKIDRAARERIAQLVADAREMVSDRRESDLEIEAFYPAYSATS
jgi:hypothetical protein